MSDPPNFQLAETTTTPAAASVDDRVQAATGLPRRVLLMSAAAVLLIVLLAASVLATAWRYRVEQGWLIHAYQVREQILDLTADLQQSEMQARSYGLTGAQAAFNGYWRAMTGVERASDELSHLVAGHPDQATDMQRLHTAIDARRALYEKILDDYRARGRSAAHADVISLVSHTDRPVLDVTDAMLAREAGRLQARDAAGRRYGRIVTVMAVLALGGSVLLIIAAFANVAREHRERTRSETALAENTVRLKQALDAAERTAATLRHLSALAEMLQNCRDLNEAIVVIERALPPLLPDTSGALALINASRNIVEARTHWGARGPELGDAVFAPEDCWALRRSQPHPGDRDPMAPVCPHLAQAGVTADHTLCLPLNSHGQVLGVLSLCAPHAFDPETRRLATTIADQLALALANLQLQASLRTQSIRDPLTNLFNRRYLEASLPRELLRAARRRGALSVLMFDLDHFKQYNDTQGHDAGDALLSSFGALLAQSCRGEDMPCRFGGEEFTVILADADHAQALQRAEAIRKATSEMVVRYRGGTLPAATVSIGVASFPEHGHAPAALFRMADQALYRAKQRGRNTVASAGDVPGVAEAATSGDDEWLDAGVRSEI